MKTALLIIDIRFVGPAADYCVNSDEVTTRIEPNIPAHP